MRWDKPSPVKFASIRERSGIMSEFIAVATIDAFPASNKLCLEVDDRFVVLVRLGADFYCLDDLCTHDGGPLGSGDLVGNCLVCPRHGARFDVRTGEAVTMPATEPTGSHSVKVEGNQIFVKLSEED